MRARENPYRTECIEKLAYRADGFNWPTLESRLIQAGGRGAIVGPQGHGKTTLLLEWQERWKAENPLWIRISEGQRFLSQEQKLALGRGRLIFVDSAEQLNWWGWRELLWCSRHAPSLVITTHRPGRLPTLFTCRTSPQLLEELVEELTGEHLPSSNLWHHHGGNLRLALRDLYDRNARHSAGMK